MSNVIAYPAKRRRARPQVYRVYKQPASEWKTPLEVKSARGWRHQWHEEILRRWDLNRSDLAVAGVLMHAFNLSRGFAEISLAKIAVRAGCSSDTALRATSKLRNFGLVVVTNEKARSRDMALETHRYRLTYRDRGVP